MKESEEPDEKSWKDRLGSIKDAIESTLFVTDTPSEDAPETAAGPSQETLQPGVVPESALPAVPSASGGEEILDLPSIYRGAGIEDQQFATPEQVLELRNTFSDLPSEAQKQKVLKTLASFKVDVAKVASNTQRKIAAIEEFVGNIRKDGASTIDTSTQTISELQKEIDTAKTRILETQKLVDSVLRAGQAATTNLRSTLDFLGVAAPPPEPPAAVKGKPQKGK